MLHTLVLSDTGDQTWGAVLEDGLVVEIHVENRGRPGIGGNIYRGRVSRVLPGMQSAFIDIGLDKDAFLHVSDLPGARVASGEMEGREEDEADNAVDPASVNHHAAPVLAPIEEHLREGQEIVVQVAKEAIASKGARVTAQIALPGRVLVYLPYVEQVFVSRRIEDPVERERLALLANSVRKGPGGWIVRTAAEGATDAVFGRDAAYLTALWARVSARVDGKNASTLLHQDLDLAERLLRDVVSEAFQEVIVDSERLEGIAKSFLHGYPSGPAVRLRLASEGSLLFDDLGIHLEIERALGSQISLESGGSIVVDQTEALVAIDVNTGKFVGTKSLEETALTTNLQAVREIVRLLRLRDLGGIIVIDFIDMVELSNRETLSRALTEELKKDRSRTKLLGMSDFGLVQLTRKRTRRSLDRALLVPCPSCKGSGRIRSPIALYYEIQRELARGAAIAGETGPVVRLHPESIARLEEFGLRLSMTRRAVQAAQTSGGARTPDETQPRLSPDPTLSEDRFEIQW